MLTGNHYRKKNQIKVLKTENCQHTFDSLAANYNFLAENL